MTNCRDKIGWRGSVCRPVGAWGFVGSRFPGACATRPNSSAPLGLTTVVRVSTYAVFISLHRSSFISIHLHPFSHRVRKGISNLLYQWISGRALVPSDLSRAESRGVSIADFKLHIADWTANGERRTTMTRPRQGGVIGCFQQGRTGWIESIADCRLHIAD